MLFDFSLNPGELEGTTVGEMETISLTLGEIGEFVEKIYDKDSNGIESLFQNTTDAIDTLDL